MNKYHLLCAVVLALTCLALIPRNVTAKSVTDHLQEEHNESLQTQSFSVTGDRKKRAVFSAIAIGTGTGVVANILWYWIKCLFVQCSKKREVHSLKSTDYIPPVERTLPKVYCPNVQSVYYLPSGADSVEVNWGGDDAVTSSHKNGIKRITQTTPSLPSGSQFPEGSYTIRYTAEDGYGNIGHCESYFSVKVVEGDLNQLSACSVTCGVGSRTRIVGEEIITEQCVTEECPVCPELDLPSDVFDQCQYLGNGEKQCNLTCHNGKLLHGYDPLSLTCGPNTGYVWNPHIPRSIIPRCVSSNQALGIDLSANYSFEVDISITENDIHSLKVPAEEIMSACVGCKTDVSVVIQVRTERAAIIIKSHTENGALDNVNGFIHAVKALYNASISGGLDVHVNHKNYAVEPSSFSLFSTMTCPVGMAPFGNLCANCAPGSYSDKYGCHQCEVGYYQDKEGQTSCISCPPEHTTADFGSASFEDCVSTGGAP